MNVFVTNRSDTDLSIGFDGVMYNFKRGTTVEIPQAGAVQLFGYGLQDREHILVRHGWIYFHSELEQGLKRLDQFEITTEMSGKNSVLPSAVVAIPLRSERNVGGKSSQKRVA